MDFIKQLLRNKKFIIGLVVVVLAGGWYVYKKAKSGAAPVSYVTAAVQKGTLVTSVSGTGQVAATNQIDVKPQGSGLVTGVYVKNGDQVHAGQTLFTLDQKSASASLAQAKASLASAQANYDKVIAGATSDDIKSAKAAVDSAQNNLDNAKKNQEITAEQQTQAVANAYSTLLNAGLEATPNDILSTATIAITGNYTGTIEGAYNLRLYQAGDCVYYSVGGLGTESGQVHRGQVLPLGNGLYITISTTGTLNPDSTWTINLPNKKATNYLSALNSYQSAQLNQTQALNQAQNQIQTAQSSLDQAQAALDTKLAAAAPADVAAAQAQIDTAKAQLQSAQSNLSNNIATAPFDGVIATLTIQRGDQASSGTAALTLITKQQIAQISLNEVDVAKVKLGQKANLTFDAIDGLTLTGTVGSIDAIGTVTQGVVSYNVKISLDSQDDRIKPGMSASASIITDVHQDVLMVPSSAIKTQGDQSYVQTLANGAPQNHNVTVGLSNDSDTEVSGDIKEGDNVITQTVTSSTTTTQTQGSILQGLGGNRTFGGGGAGAVRVGGGAAGGR